MALAKRLSDYANTERDVVKGLRFCTRPKLNLL